MVATVPDHLDEIEPHGADGAAISEVFFGSEGGQPQILFLDPGGQRVALCIARPNVDVGIDDPVCVGVGRHGYLPVCPGLRPTRLESMSFGAN